MIRGLRADDSSADGPCGGFNAHHQIFTYNNTGLLMGCLTLLTNVGIVSIATDESLGQNHSVKKGRV